MKGEIKNAKITSTKLGVEDHGIFTCYLDLDYHGAGQAFGGYGMDQFDKLKDERVGTKWGMDFIIKLLKVVGVEKWEDLVGKHVRVEASHNKIHRIGNILKDEWFDPTTLELDE